MAYTALSFEEAKLFARAGMDLRLHDWPPQDFVRWVNAPVLLPGYIAVPFTPTAAERNSLQWEVA